jgi:hypothetical protein
MKREYVISEEAFDALRIALSEGKHWIVFNEERYFLEKEDFGFFLSKKEAEDFAFENHTSTDVYRILHALSILDVLRQIPYRSNLLNLNAKIMNQQNLDYLKDQLKFMGFGDKLYAQLEKELGKGDPSFQLHHENEIGGKAFAAVLNFRKSDNTDLYFFNSYHATLQRKDGEVTDQSFYLNKGKGVTAKEAYNLLDGRAVHKQLASKEGQSYHAWIQLDFEKRDNNNNHEVRQYHDNYGYDLREALSKYAISELTHPEKGEALLQSLQKGNLQAVSLEKEGSVTKLFVEANPQFKSVTLYDDHLRRVPKEGLEQYLSPAVDKDLVLNMSTKKELNGKEVGPEKGKDVKQNPSTDVKAPTKKGKGVKDLLPKNETEKKKGVKIG